MRVLVTGSRQVTSEDRPLLTDALLLLVGEDPGPPGQHTLVHGDAPGADRVFAAIATDWEWRVEAHPADWYADCRPECKPGHRRPDRRGVLFCPAAGVYRNTRMVALGADLGVAVYKRGAQNRGTTHCLSVMRAADMPVQRVVV